jgi:hypothetical protein
MLLFISFCVLFFIYTFLYIFFDVLMIRKIFRFLEITKKSILLSLFIVVFCKITKNHYCNNNIDISFVREIFSLLFIILSFFIRYCVIGDKILCRKSLTLILRDSILFFVSLFYVRNFSS